MQFMNRERERERERESFGLNAMCMSLTARSMMSLLERRVAVMVDEFIGLNEFGIYSVTCFLYMYMKQKKNKLLIL